MIIERKYKYVHEDVDRWGNVRFYFRRALGLKKVRIRARPNTEEFERQYRALLEKARDGILKHEPSTAPKVGTFRWLGCKWLTSSDFKQRDPRTQRVTQLILESMYLEPISPQASDLFGDWQVVHFKAKAVRILRDRKAERPEGANNRVRRLRALFNWAVQPENEELGITENPARDVPFLKPNRVGGFPTWKLEDIEKFEARHQVGTRARLALGLLMYTGCRRSDVVQLGKQHMRSGRLTFRQHKGRNHSPVMVDIPVLPVLQDIIDTTTTGDLALLTTEQGRPFTANGFGGWFRDRCDEAGLPHLSAHGVRKAAATRAAENGATAHQLMAIFGWLTIKQAEHYTRGAHRKVLADAGMHTLGTKRVENFPTLEAQSGVVGKLATKK